MYVVLRIMYYVRACSSTQKTTRARGRFSIKKHARSRTLFYKQITRSRTLFYEKTRARGRSSIKQARAR